MHIDYPFHVDSRGRTAQTTDDDHIRDLIEQVLFTSPGERVNRPDFGSGLQGIVFEPNGEAVAAALRARVEAALQRWLADIIALEAVTTRSEDGVLEVTVQYVERVTAQRRTETLRSGQGAR